MASCKLKHHNLRLENFLGACCPTNTFAPTPSSTSLGSSEGRDVIGFKSEGSKKFTDRLLGTVLILACPIPAEFITLLDLRFGQITSRMHGLGSLGIECS